jgi:uncharacterized circularly permuted ATP-grasp superfamily protein
MMLSLLTPSNSSFLNSSVKSPSRVSYCSEKRKMSKRTFRDLVFGNRLDVSLGSVDRRVVERFIRSSENTSLGVD